LQIILVPLTYLNMSKQIWVTPTESGWKVKQPDNSKASAIT